MFSRDRISLPTNTLSNRERPTSVVERVYRRKPTSCITRWIPATALLLLTCYYFGNVYAIIRDSIRITGGFGTFEAILLLWAAAPWALLVVGLAPGRRTSRTE